MSCEEKFLMYQTEDGEVRLDVHLEDETVWLSQAQMAQLFQKDRSVISKHIKNVFSEGEVDEKSNVHFWHIANSDRLVAFYSLDIILSVGYCVKSLRGTQFRIWATQQLKEYIVKGFLLDDERLKQGKIIFGNKLQIFLPNAVLIIAVIQILRTGFMQ